jgi:hypothetical protein
LSDVVIQATVKRANDAGVAVKIGDGDDTGIIDSTAASLVEAIEI